MWRPTLLLLCCYQLGPGCLATEPQTTAQQHGIINGQRSPSAASSDALLLVLLLAGLGRRRSRRRCGLLAALMLAVFVLLPARSLARPQSPIDQAWALYQQGDATRAAELARDLLSSLTAPEELREAHLVLAAAAHLRGDEAGAIEQLVTALAYDPGYEPDPLKLPPDFQVLVRQVTRTRAAEIRARAATLAQQQQPPPPPASQPAQSQVEPSDRLRQPAAAPSPPLDRDKEAAARPPTPLLVASASCLATALSLRTQNGRYLPGDLDTARSLNIAYLVTGYAALGLMLYGAVDGVQNRHRPGAAGRLTASREHGPRLTGCGELGLGLAVDF